MTRSVLSVLFVVVLGAPPALAGAADPPAPARAPAPAPGPAPGQRADIDVATLKAERDAGRIPILVDVRTPGEFSRGHVPGAVNIPIDDLARRIGELDRFRGGPIHVICEVGGRSSTGTDQLVAGGHHAVNVKGGTRAWREAGYPTE